MLLRKVEMDDIVLQRGDEKWSFTKEKFISIQLGKALWFLRFIVDVVRGKPSKKKTPKSVKEAEFVKDYCFI